jgi:hypothetical protein
MALPSRRFTAGCRAAAGNPANAAIVTIRIPVLVRIEAQLQNGQQLQTGQQRVYRADRAGSAAMGAAMHVKL